MSDARALTVRVGGASTTALLYSANTPPPHTADTSVRHPSDTRSRARVSDAAATIVLAHGAGADQRHPFMVAVARGLAERGIDVATFNFLYTEQRRRPPDRAPSLEACYLAVFEAVRQALPNAARRTFIGGKSMGGRIATELAASRPDLPVAGIVLLGYPLHPPGKPEQRRDKHLPSIRCPVLFVQGSRDAFGTPAELAPAASGMHAATLQVVDGGDHSFKPAGITGDICRTIVAWISAVTGTRG